MKTVISADGTPIAYDRAGSGDPLTLGAPSFVPGLLHLMPGSGSGLPLSRTRCPMTPSLWTASNPAIRCRQADGQRSRFPQS
jgi:hypothetical protein